MKSISIPYSDFTACNSILEYLCLKNLKFTNSEHFVELELYKGRQSLKNTVDKRDKISLIRSFRRKSSIALLKQVFLKLAIAACSLTHWLQLPPHQQVHGMDLTLKKIRLSTGHKRKNKAHH